jgi:predicted component of type VI protein secretion system
LFVKQAFVPQLIAISEGVNIALDKPIVLLGRHQECDVQIPSRKISRRHCCLAQVDDHLVVRDLGSTNGIRINGIKVVEGNLQPEDELTIGNVRYRLKWGAESEATAREAQEHDIQMLPMAQLLPMNGPNESCDDPMPLPNAVLSKEALLGKPKSLDIPDCAAREPLETSQKS